jgi:hypothetical protein
VVDVAVELYMAESAVLFIIETMSAMAGRATIHSDKSHAPS